MVDPQTLNRIPRFAGISADARDWVLPLMTQRYYQRGDSIFIEGDPCEYLYLVLGGAVKVYKTLESGRELIMNIMGPGEAVGEVALIDGIELPASAAAQADTSLILLGSANYLQYLQKFPEAPRMVIRDLASRLRSMYRRMEQLGDGGVEIRIAHVLLTFLENMSAAEPLKKSPEGVLIPLHLSRQDIASMVGARIETVIRVMSRWHKADLVHSVAEGCLIPDPEKLKQIIEAD